MCVCVTIKKILASPFTQQHVGHAVAWQPNRVPAAEPATAPEEAAATPWLFYSTGLGLLLMSACDYVSELPDLTFIEFYL